MRITNLRRIGSITAVVVIALHRDDNVFTFTRPRVGRNLKTARVHHFESADTAYKISFCVQRGPGPGQTGRKEGSVDGKVWGGGGKLRVHARSTFYIRTPRVRS